jgi:hypothetical protein
MPFWSNTVNENGGLAKDPKRSFRWIVLVNAIPAYVLKKVDKPSFSLGDSEHKFLNHTYYYPGRVTWNEITMSLADPVDPDMSGTITSIINSAGYKPAQGPGDLSTMSKAKAVAALGQELEIQQIDSEGQWVERWLLTNPFIKDVKYGSLDYESDDLIEIELTIKYDWASIEHRSDPYEGAKNPSPDKTYWKLTGGGGS